MRKRLIRSQDYLIDQNGTLKQYRNMGHAKTDRRAPILQSQIQLLKDITSEPIDISYTNGTHSALRIKGFLNASSLKNAIATVAQNNPILLCSIKNYEESDPYFDLNSKRHPRVVDVNLSEVDSSHKEKMAESIVNEFIWDEFCISSDPLMRCLIVKMDDNDHIFCYVVYHFIADFVSIKLLNKQILCEYAASFTGKVVDQNVYSRHGYDEYVNELNYWISSPMGKNCLRYWMETLRNLPATRFNIVEYTVNRKITVTEKHLFISSRQVRRLSLFAKSAEVTLFVLFLTAKIRALRKAILSRDITVGVISDSRHIARYSKCIGFFINYLIIRPKMDAQSKFSDDIRSVNEAYIMARRNGKMPSHIICQKLAEVGGSDIFPIFNFIDARVSQSKSPRDFDKSSMDKLSIRAFPVAHPPVEVASIEKNRKHSFDITLTNDGAKCLLRYSPEVFQASSADDFCDSFISIINSI